MALTDSDPGRWQQRFAKALLDGDHKSASQVIDEFKGARHTAIEVYQQLITPALTAIGDLCCNGGIRVGQEKLATQITLRQLERLRTKDPAENRLSPHRVMVSCVQGEEHFIGSRMAADLFLAKGWLVDFLGPNVPSEALVEMVKSRRPQLLALSGTMDFGIAHAGRVIDEVMKISEPPKVLISGHALRRDASLLRHGPDCRAVQDLAEGLETAAALLQLNRPKIVLRDYLLEIGSRIRELRLEAGMTQEQLAEAARVTRVCIVSVEGGKQNISMDIVVRIAGALAVSPERLLVSDARAAITGRGAI